MAVEHRLFCSLALVLLTAGVAQPWGGFPSFKDQSKSYSCSKDDNQCKLTQVVLESDGDIERATFEGLLDQVVVASGRIPRFTAALANRLPDVSDLTLDRLSIVKLYVSASLTDLSAVGNEIDELLLDESGGDGPYRMISLYLSHNKLAALPSLARFGKLKHLKLDHNLLPAVDVAAFAALTALRKLSLAHNRLHTVTGTVQLDRLDTLSFAGNELVALNVTGWELDALEDLSLADNGLTRVEGNLTQFGALRKLALAGNRLHCEWLMAEPLLVASSPQLQLDADGVDRCEADNLLPSGDHCCTHGGGGGAGFGLLSVYQEKWDQLERLAQLIGTLNASIANGSVAVRTELARQHDALSVRLDELARNGESHAEQLQTLEQRLGAHRDALDTLETDLAGRVGELRTELEARWNETLATNGTHGDGSSSSSPGWSRAAAQHEATLARLRTDLETVRGQFNVLNTKCYDPRPRLQEQSRRIDQLNQELARSRERHRELREKYGEREDKVNAMYELYSRLLVLQSNSTDERNIIPEVDESADQLDDSADRF